MSENNETQLDHIIKTVRVKVKESNHDRKHICCP